MEIFTIKQQIIEKFDIEPFSIDSRKIQNGQIFLALKGERSNGAEFSKNAEELGCSLIIADTKNVNVEYTKQIIVENTAEYLVKIAEYSRKKLKGKNISITGSIGKTTTKDLISFLLSTKYKIFSNNGNYNNAIGLPLTIANSPSNIDFLITEMGANHIGEIKCLSKIAQPNICIITKIGHAHIGEFGSLNNISKAKSEIFVGADKGFTAILNRDDISFDFLKTKAMENTKLKNIISFGKHIDADIRYIGYNIKNNEILISTDLNNEKKDYSIPIQTYNTAIVESTIIAIATIISIGDTIEEYISKFKSFALDNGRNKKIILNNPNITIIDGSYNSSIESLFASINDMIQVDTTHANDKYKIAFIGRIGELGKFEKEINKKIELFLSKKITNNEINLIVTIGEDFLNKKQFLHFNSTEELLDEYLQKIIDNIAIKKSQEHIILVKGSNYLKMHRIVDFFIQQREQNVNSTLC